MKFPFLDALNNADESFIEEVFEYEESLKRRRRYTVKNIIGITAAAACAALIFGAGIFAFGRRGLESKPDAGVPAPIAPAPEITAPETTAPADVVEVEPSYNDRIANGETVTVETYIGKRIEYQDLAFTLKDITISPTFPEGITKDDISFTPIVTAYTDDDSEDNILGFVGKSYDYGEYAAEHGLPPIESEEDYGWYTVRKLAVSDVIDDSGLYQGPMDVPDEAYKWVFLELEIENLTDGELLEYMADMELCGGEYVVHPTAAAAMVDGEPVWGEAPYSFYAYSTEVSYMSEHTGEELYDGQAEGKKFHNLVFAPRETKTLVLGYCVSDHFVYGDLFLNLHNSEFTYMDDFVYLPLK